MKSKALSVQQPYALLEVTGVKDIENRTWKTDFRGRLYIHACGKRMGKINYHLTEEQMSIIDPATTNILLQDEKLMYSSIIGYVDLIDVVENHPSVWALPGHYHWVLANPVMFSSPIVNVKGKLSLWNCSEFVNVKQSVKLLFFDVETTGIDSKVHGVHQLSGDIVIDDEVKESFNFNIRPFKGCEINSEAMAISNTTAMDLMKYQPEDTAFYCFKHKIQSYLDWNNKNDKFFLVGWRNPGFDDRFLEALFERHGAADAFKSLFWNHSIDVKVMATAYLKDQRHEMDSFSLAPVASRLGIDVNENKLHDAGYDTYLTRMVYYKLIGR